MIDISFLFEFSNETELFFSKCFVILFCPAGGTTTMTEGLATPLRSVLTCGGCCQRFDDGSRRPKFLSCFHTACLICLRKGFSDGKVRSEEGQGRGRRWEGLSAGG